MVQDPKAALGKPASSSAEIAVGILFEFATAKPDSIRRILLRAAEAGVCPKEAVPSAASAAGGSELLSFILVNQAVLPVLFADPEFVAFFRARFPKSPLPTSRAPSGGSSSPIRNR